MCRLAPSSLQKYETISPSLTNHFHGLKIPGTCFKNKEGNLSCAAMRHQRWAPSTQLSRWVSLNMFTVGVFEGLAIAPRLKAAEVINPLCASFLASFKWKISVRYESHFLFVPRQFSGFA